jgi:integrase
VCLLIHLEASECRARLCTTDGLVIEVPVKFKFTQRGMRRTYNDLSRAADVKPEIIRSISGHHTEQMREWYSTYRSRERRAGIAAVVALVAAHKAVGEDSAVPTSKVTGRTPPR